MITPKLEELIFCGKAFFKTLVVGGSQKFNFKIQNDRFIIITDLTYFSSGHFNTDTLGANNNFANISQQGMNTQLTILGEKGINRFLFRNSFVNVGENTQQLLPFGNTNLNVYLLHTTQVSFTFSFAQNLVSQTTGVVPPEFFGIASPTDYGKDGVLPNEAVTLSAVVQGANSYVNLYNRQAAPGANESNELAFPLDNVNNISDVKRTDSWSYPILLVNYVEIMGLPNNIGQ